MRWTWLGSFLAATSFAAPSIADTAMFSFPEPALAVDSARGTDGFRFKPKVDIEVTALGYYDHDQNGFFVASYPVALYDFASRARLAKVGVVGTDPLDGLFRYAAIEPILLHAGVSYVVAGYTPPMSNSNVDNPPGLTTASEITFEGYRFIPDGADVAFPTETFGDPFFGPNLLFRATGTTTPGDTNSDGVVNLDDLNNVRNHFGETGAPIVGDTTPFDGVVDLDDLNSVRNNFGAGPSGTVPEPGAGALAICGLLCVPAKRAARKLMRPRETSC